MLLPRRQQSSDPRTREGRTTACRRTRSNVLIMRHLMIVLYVLCTATTAVAAARLYHSAVTSSWRRCDTSRHVPATRRCLPAHGRALGAFVRASLGCGDAAGEADALPAHGPILSPRYKHAAEVEGVKEHARNAAF
ncbi:hypothetical protein VTO73DRAFT_14543 [Trametes versicolor]